MNVYCMRTGSCEDKLGYLQNAEGERCFDGPSCRVADDVTIMRSNFFDASSLCVRTMHDKPGSVSRVNISQHEALLFPASCRHE